MSIAPPSGVSVSYRQQYRRCGKPTCVRCASSGPGHGPYWYAVWWDGARIRSHYLGKAPPSPTDAPTPPTAAPDVEPILRVQTLGGFAVWREGTPAVAGWGSRAPGCAWPRRWAASGTFTVI